MRAKGNTRKRQFQEAGCVLWNQMLGQTFNHSDLDILFLYLRVGAQKWELQLPGFLKNSSVSTLMNRMMQIH